MHDFFRDPISLDILEEPAAKTYEVTLRINGGPRETALVDTLTEETPTHSFLKRSLAGRLDLGSPREGDITIVNFHKVREDNTVTTFL